MITTSQYDDYFKSLGTRFILAGDLNAKHTDWGSRLTNKKGRNLIDAIKKNSCKFTSTGEPMYWPTDRNKPPDLIDFCITKNIKCNQLKIRSCLELSSDHSPIILDYTTDIKPIELPTSIFNQRTNWKEFRQHIDHQLRIKLLLRTQLDIERAIIHFNDVVLDVGSKSTPQQNISQIQTFNRQFY